MKELIESAKDFKIIPNNFKSSGAFDVIELDDEKIVIKLDLVDDNELQDYTLGSSVEVFGVNNLGLIYFETVILNKENKKITIAMPSDYSLIQRREYSRVGLNQGKITFNDLASDFVEEVLDISAGGIKINTISALDLDKKYDIEIALGGNMKINCKLQPVRIKQNKNNYTISGKFTELENVDRIVLVQYAFKIKMEEQNKEN